MAKWGPDIIAGSNFWVIDKISDSIGTTKVDEQLAQPRQIHIYSYAQNDLINKIITTVKAQFKLSMKTSLNETNDYKKQQYHYYQNIINKMTVATTGPVEDNEEVSTVHPIIEETSSFEELNPEDATFSPQMNEIPFNESSTYVKTTQMQTTPMQTTPGKEEEDEEDYFYDLSPDYYEDEYDYSEEQVTQNAQDTLYISNLTNLTVTIFYDDSVGIDLQFA